MAQHAIFSRIPVIRSIYGLTEQVAGHLSAYDGHEFSRVVLVEWPKPNVYAVGFVTGHCDMKGDDSKRVAVYIPTVPNPTSGMFALMRLGDVVDTEITVEEAIKLVLSGGIVLPEHMNDIVMRPRGQADTIDIADTDEIIDADSVVTVGSYRNGQNGHKEKQVTSEVVN